MNRKGWEKGKKYEHYLSKILPHKQFMKNGSKEFGTISEMNHSCLTNTDH